MVQMIGRGLRTIDPEEFPDVVKTDCVVMDFGTSVLTHGSLEDQVNLDDREKGEAPEKECPSCEALVPLGVQECPICGHIFESQPEEKEELAAFSMTEYDLMQMSPFRWIDLFGNGSLRMAMGFEGFVGVANTSDLSVAFGKHGRGKVRILSVGGPTQATAAADDFLREIEDGGAAKKTKRWLDQSMSEKQREHLAMQGINVSPMDFSWTKYKQTWHSTRSIGIKTMARFELKLTIALAPEEGIECVTPDDPLIKEEYTIISFVKNSSNKEEVVKKIKTVVDYYVESAEAEVLFALATTEVAGEKILISSLNSDWNFTLEEMMAALDVEIPETAPRGATIH